MSFSIWYRPTPTSPDYTLTAFIGSGGQVYWLQSDVAKILKRKPRFGCGRPDCTHVSSVMGGGGLARRLLLLQHPKLRARRLFSHDTVLKLFAASSNYRVREFGRQLDSPETRVKCFKRNNVQSLDLPSQLFMHNSSSSSSSVENLDGFEYFFVWYEFFRQSVMRTLYHRPAFDLSKFLQLEDDEEPTNDFKTKFCLSTV